MRIAGIGCCPASACLTAPTQLTTTSGLRLLERRSQACSGSSALMPAIRVRRRQELRDRISTGLTNRAPALEALAPIRGTAGGPACPWRRPPSRASQSPPIRDPEAAGEPSQSAAAMLVGEPGQGVASAQGLHLAARAPRSGAAGRRAARAPFANLVLRALGPGACRDLPRVAIDDEVALAGSVEAGRDHRRRQHVARSGRPGRGSPRAPDRPHRRTAASRIRSLSSAISRPRSATVSAPPCRRQHASGSSTRTNRPDAAQAEPELACRPE